MKRLLIFYAAAVLALASSAAAYTYACEEGRFTIDVPEGWATEAWSNLDTTGEDSGGVRIIWRETTGNASDYTLEIYYGPVRSWHWRNVIPNSYKQGEFDFNTAFNKAYASSSGIPGRTVKKLNERELIDMNVEEGFTDMSTDSGSKLLFFEGFLVKNDIVYHIFTMLSASLLYSDPGLIEAINESAIKTLNSFRALN